MFTSSDGTEWKQYSARALSAIEIWNGNRIMDVYHVQKIRDSLNGNVSYLNQNPFRVVHVRGENGETLRYIVDGQHRIQILRDYFTNPEVADFQVIVIVKECDTEADVISYFKIINTTKSIAWKEDPILCANRFIEPLLGHFNTNKKQPLIRTGKTVRPYLSVDKLRSVLVERKIVEWGKSPTEFLEHAIETNTIMLNEIRQRQTKTPMEEKSIALEFALGIDMAFVWI